MYGCKNNPSWIDAIPKEIKCGRNYHVVWQRHSGMRFILKQVHGDKVELGTMHDKRTFIVPKSDLRNTKHHFGK